MDNSSVIEIQNLSKSYRTKMVLKDLSLSIPKGSVFGLLGKNGEGKTTLLKCILGLLKPSAGRIAVLSDQPWNFRDSTKEKIGYVPQSDRPYPWLTVGQLIDYTASFYPHWNEKLVSKLIKEWEILLEEKVGVLSEGEAQKISIILSLGHEPELLIFDEPVASLDPGARRQFLRTILEIVSNRECTIFFSTHITSDLERVADRVAILKDGGLRYSGELDGLKEEAKRLRIFTQQPFPTNFQCPGLLHCEASDQEAIASIIGFNEELKETLEQQLGAQIHVEDLNLEEIFLELNR